MPDLGDFRGTEANTEVYVGEGRWMPYPFARELEFSMFPANRRAMEADGRMTRAIAYLTDLAPRPMTDAPTIGPEDVQLIRAAARACQLYDYYFRAALGIENWTAQGERELVARYAALAERLEALLRLFTREDVALLRHAADYAKPEHPELRALAARIEALLPPETPE